MNIKRTMNKFKNMKQIYLRFNLLRNEMIHFISNFFNYIMVEAIEAAWNNFNEKFDKAKDFNEII